MDDTFTTAPDACPRMIGGTACATRNVPVRLIRRTASRSATETLARTRRATSVPALLTSTSTRPTRRHVAHEPVDRSRVDDVRRGVMRGVPLLGQRPRVVVQRSRLAGRPARPSPPRVRTRLRWPPEARPSARGDRDLPVTPCHVRLHPARSSSASVPPDGRLRRGPTRAAPGTAEDDRATRGVPVAGPALPCSRPHVPDGLLVAARWARVRARRTVAIARRRIGLRSWPGDPGRSPAGDRGGRRRREPEWP